MVLCAFLCSCEERQEKQTAHAVDETLSKKEKITELKWVEGHFRFKSSHGIYDEQWRKIADNEYAGRGWYLHKNDTLFAMKMRLYLSEGLVKMDYNVKGQNEGKDVEFALSKHEGDLYVFENPFRGFPSIMQYKFLGDTAINIVERGFENNEAREQDFIMERIN